MLKRIEDPSFQSVSTSATDLNFCIYLYKYRYKYSNTHSIEHIIEKLKKCLKEN